MKERHCMKDPLVEAERWLRQAENDLEFAKSGYKEGFFSQVCFLTQQIAEKAVKALRYANGEQFVLGHSIYKLLSDIPEIINKVELMDIAGVLDQYYIPARYPNGLPEGAPFEVYTQKQADEAIIGAERIVKTVESILEIRKKNR